MVEILLPVQNLYGPERRLERPRFSWLRPQLPGSQPRSAVPGASSVDEAQLTKSFSEKAYPVVY